MDFRQVGGFGERWPPGTDDLAGRQRGGTAADENESRTNAGKRPARLLLERPPIQNGHIRIGDDDCEILLFDRAQRRASVGGRLQTTSPG